MIETYPVLGTEELREEIASHFGDDPTIEKDRLEIDRNQLQLESDEPSLAEIVFTAMASRCGRPISHTCHDVDGALCFVSCDYQTLIRILACQPPTALFGQE